jgi:hypothetical protein
MRLASLSIQGFRGITQGEISDFADVNILVGRNNSGKSTVAEAISYLRRRDSRAVDAIGRGIYEEWRRIRGDNAPEDDYSLTGKISDATDPERNIQCVVRGNTPTTKVLINGESHRSSAGSRPAKQQPFGLGDVPGLDGFLGKSTVFWPQDGMNPNIERVLWERLIRDRQDKSVVELLGNVYSIAAESLNLLPNGHLFVLLPNRGLSLDVFGDGTRLAVRCALLFAVLKHTLFIYEEPECHQHPGALARLAMALCKQAKTQDVQLFLTTHSIECARAYLLAAEAAGSSGALFHLKLELGNLESRRMDRESVERLWDTGLDVRNLDLYV